MTHEHTKGPWTLCPENDGAFTIWAGERQIAEIAPDDMGDTLPAKANARLIAAAPDLLAALAPLVNAAPKDGGMIRLDGDELARARAAIAKAKGD